MASFETTTRVEKSTGAVEAGLPTVVKAPESNLRHIVIVGGGAGGLELAIALGNKLGKRRCTAVTLVEKARTRFWQPHLHEIAAGSMDLDLHATDYLAQSRWHRFRYRVGETIKRRVTRTFSRLAIARRASGRKKAAPCRRARKPCTNRDRIWLNRSSSISRVSP